MSLPDYLREDLRRIWNTYSGLVPDAQLRAFIETVTGEPQPDRGPVTVLDRDELVFVYGLDPCEGDNLVFVTLDDLEKWAPLAVAAEAAGTWARFVELGGSRAEDLRDSLAASARYPDFESFRDHDPNPDAIPLDGADDWDDEDGEADDDDPDAPAATEDELRAAYAELNCPDERGPLDDEPLLRDDFFGWDEEHRLEWFDPNEAMCEVMPEAVSREFGAEYYAVFGEGPFARYRASDEEDILAVFARLGYTVVRDDRLIATFWGFEEDLPEVERHLATLREAQRLLAGAWAAAGEGSEDDDEEDDG